MNWDAIGAIGEIVSAIAVLATLIYLAIQIRQSSATQRAQTHQQLAHERTLNVRMLITNKEIRDATAKSSSESLSLWMSKAFSSGLRFSTFEHMKTSCTSIQRE